MSLEIKIKKNKREERSFHYIIIKGKKNKQVGAKKNKRETRKDFNIL